jgi:hypothetical protein
VTFDIYVGHDKGTTVRIQAITPDRVEIMMLNTPCEWGSHAFSVSDVRLADLERFMRQLGEWRDAFARGDDPTPFVDFVPSGEASGG